MPASGILRRAVELERTGTIEIRGLLGRGGMSEVFLGLVHGPGEYRRRVVLKRLLPWLAGTDPRATQILANEAKLLARIDHPAVVTLLDFRLVGGLLTLVLELVDGVSLAAACKLLRARGQPLSDGASLFLAHRLFGALSAVHAAVDPETGRSAPIVHRDVSPGNLLLPWDGYAKLADFGIAVLAGAEGDTPAGIVKGTYRYMAPEQIIGGGISVASDVYAGCVIVRELLTRARLFPRASGRRSLGAIFELSLTPTRALRPDLPRPLADLIDAGLEPDPDARRVTAREIAAAVAATMPMDEARRELADALQTVRRAVKPAEGEDATAPTVRGAQALEEEPPTLPGVRWRG